MISYHSLNKPYQYLVFPPGYSHSTTAASPISTTRTLPICPISITMIMILAIKSHKRWLAHWTVACRARWFRRPPASNTPTCRHWMCTRSGLTPTPWRSTKNQQSIVALATLCLRTIPCIIEEAIDDWFLFLFLMSTYLFWSDCTP